MSGVSISMDAFCFFIGWILIAARYPSIFFGIFYLTPSNPRSTLIAMKEPRFIHDRMPTLAEREQFAESDFRGCGWMFGVMLIIVLAFAFSAIRAHMDGRANSPTKQETPAK